jgi:hypothetical protein
MIIVLMCLQPCPLRKRQRVSAVKTTMSGKVDVLDAGVGKTELRSRKAVGLTVVGSQSCFPIEHQANEKNENTRAIGKGRVGKQHFTKNVLCAAIPPAQAPANT